MTDDYPEFTEESGEPSKSELKRQMQALQDLGKQLTSLPPKELEKFPLEESLLEALQDYQRFKQREAKRRQLQYIGKLMRQADIESIEQALALRQADSDAAKQRLHKLEYWREQLLLGSNDVIELALAEFPGLDRQHIRQLQRQARKEEELVKPPAARRKLFKYLKELADQG